MTKQQQTPARSTVTIDYHPIHPMAVVFPVAFLTTLPLVDVVYWWTGDGFWTDVARWLVTAGVVAGIGAAVVGLIDFLTVREVRRHMASWSHLLTAVTLLALASANLHLRWTAPDTVFPWGFTLSLATAGMVMVAAWLGGTLTFRHRIGVYEHHSD